MSLNDFKPLGAFIENTIRPIIQEAGDIIAELQRAGIGLTEENISNLVTKIVDAHIKTVFIESIKTIIIAGIIAYTWMICQ